MVTWPGSPRSWYALPQPRRKRVSGRPPRCPSPGRETRCPCDSRMLRYHSAPRDDPRKGGDGTAASRTGRIRRGNRIHDSSHLLVSSLPDFCWSPASRAGGDGSCCPSCGRAGLPPDRGKRHQPGSEEPQGHRTAPPAAEPGQRSNGPAERARLGGRGVAGLADDELPGFECPPAHRLDRPGGLGFPDAGCLPGSIALTTWRSSGPDRHFLACAPADRAGSRAEPGGDRSWPRFPTGWLVVRPTGCGRAIGPWPRSA